MVIDMKQLIKIEWFKLLRNKKNWVIVFACIVLMLINGYQNMAKNEEFIKDRIYYLDQESDNALMQRDELEKEMQGIDENSKEWKALIEQYDFWSYETDASRLLLGYYKNRSNSYGTDQMIAELSIERDRKLVEAVQKKYSGILFEFYTPEKEIKERQNEIYIIQELIKENDENLRIDSDAKFLYSSPYEMNGLNFLAIIFDNGIFLFITLLLFLIVSDLYTKEIEQGSYKFYMTSPYHRSQIIVAKIMSAALFSILFISLSLAIGFIVFSIWNDIGDIKYPYVVGTAQTTPCYIYLLKLGILTLISIIFLITVFMYLSLHTKSEAALISIGAGILLCTYFIYNLFYLTYPNIIELPFLSHIYIGSLVQYKNGLLGYIIGNVVSIMLFVYLSVSRFNKLDLKEG